MGQGADHGREIAQGIIIGDHAGGLVRQGRAQRLVTRTHLKLPLPANPILQKESRTQGDILAVQIGPLALDRNRNRDGWIRRCHNYLPDDKYSTISKDIDSLSAGADYSEAI